VDGPRVERQSRSCFLIFDGAIKLVPIQPVTDSLRELGYPASDSFARFLGRHNPHLHRALCLAAHRAAGRGFC